jgi:hypothetical protein
MSEAHLIKTYKVQILKPERTPRGITVFLPGTLLKLKDYKSTYDAIVKEHQIVIAFEDMNPFPFVGRSHDKMAEDVASVVQEFRALKGNGYLPAKYNIIGHSLGGKVCLMVAAKFDIENVNKIIALDPVDDKPRELTAPKQSPKTNLGNSKAKEVHLFQSEKGGERSFLVGPALCPPDRNASVIQEFYPDKITSFEINEGAGHMSYLDKETGDADKKAREVVQAKICKVIR